MGCKQWGIIIGWCKGLFISLVNNQVTVFIKDITIPDRTSCVILDHKGWEDQCGLLEGTYKINIIPETNGIRC